MRSCPAFKAAWLEEVEKQSALQTVTWHMKPLFVWNSGRSLSRAFSANSSDFMTFCTFLSAFNSNRVFSSSLRFCLTASFHCCAMVLKYETSFAWRSFHCPTAFESSNACNGQEKISQSTHWRHQACLYQVWPLYHQCPAKSIRKQPALGPQIWPMCLSTSNMSSCMENEKSQECSTIIQKATSMGPARLSAGKSRLRKRRWK